MSSPRSEFRIAVKKTPSRERREAASDALADGGATDQLSILVKSDGLDGAYRRQALEGLGQCDARAELDALADDDSLHASIRDRAAELAG
jgi:hypothetical protein